MNWQNKVLDLIQKLTDAINGMSGNPSGGGGAPGSATPSLEVYPCIDPSGYAFLTHRYWNGSQYVVENFDPDGTPYIPSGAYRVLNEHLEFLVSDQYSLVQQIANLLGIDLSDSSVPPAMVGSIADSLLKAQPSDYSRVMNASDLAQTFLYDDAGLADERVTSVISTSASVGKTVTETFTYDGNPGAYYLSSKTRVVD